MKKSVGCLSILGIIVIIGGLYYYSKRDRVSNLVYQKSLHLFKREVMSRLPVEFTKVQAEQLFNQALRKLQSEDFDKRKLQTLKKNIVRSVSDGKLDSLEVKLLMENLKEFTNPKHK
ncbi:MAG: hypothetical protein ACE5HI_07695 [bacterium]